MIKKGETYIIGEIGQNHNGSCDIAKLIVELVARPVREEAFGIDLKPMNAVKMTKRDLNDELTVSQMNRIYDTPHSFGRTDGEHRAFLELDDGLTTRCTSMPSRWVLTSLKLFVPRDACRCSNSLPPIT